MTRRIALDTETTGLDPRTEYVFEIAAVDIDTGQEWVWTLEPHQSWIDDMHPRAAEVNRYHERTLAHDWEWSAPYGNMKALERVLDEVREVLDGAHIVGAVPGFDAMHLDETYRRWGQECPRWHYHLIDVEVLAVGYIAAARRMMGSLVGPLDALDTIIGLPYRSDDLSRFCGIDPPSDDERHTALGDARWVARWYRALMDVEVSA